MSHLKIIFLLLILVCGPAAADIWKWVDAEGKTHFVATSTAIYTWYDEAGEPFYSDTPDHEDAVAVQLVWHSEGSLEELKESANSSSDGYAFPGETPEQRAEREDAEAYYCKRATQIFDSYKNAPRLYRTNDAGEREYLSAEDAEVALVETKSTMDGLCS